MDHPDTAISPLSKSPLNEAELLATIAHDLMVPQEDLEDLFVLVVQRFLRESTIHDYLPVMIPRRVKELYFKKMQD